MQLDASKQARAFQALFIQRLRESYIQSDHPKQRRHLLVLNNRAGG